jgi:hypothetical protein
MSTPQSICSGNEPLPGTLSGRLPRLWIHATYLHPTPSVHSSAVSTSSPHAHDRVEPTTRPVDNSASHMPQGARNALAVMKARGNQWVRVGPHRASNSPPMGPNQTATLTRHGIDGAWIESKLVTDLTTGLLGRCFACSPTGVKPRPRGRSAPPVVLSSAPWEARPRAAFAGAAGLANLRSTRPGTGSDTDARERQTLAAPLAVRTTGRRTPADDRRRTAQTSAGRGRSTSQPCR